MKHVSIGSNVISGVFSWRVAIPPAEEADASFRVQKLPRQFAVAK